MEWFIANKLSLNVSKRKLIIFKSKNNKLTNTDIVIKIQNRPIEWVTSTKFVGVIIDEEGLTWNNHIHTISQKIMRSTGLIAKLRHFVNLNTLKLFYCALVYPYLTYGNLTWAITYPTKLEKLHRIQKKIIRLMKLKSFTETQKNYFMI